MDVASAIIRHFQASAELSVTIGECQVYPDDDWQMASKDDFSQRSIPWCWEQGYRNALQTIKQGGGHAGTSEHKSVIVHNIARKPRTGG